MTTSTTQVTPQLQLVELASLVKFLEVAHTFAIDSSIFSAQEAEQIGQGYLSLREQLEEFKNNE